MESPAGFLASVTVGQKCRIAASTEALCITYSLQRVQCCEPWAAHWMRTREMRLEGRRSDEFYLRDL